MPNLWMFNDGSYKHRGVWHAVDKASVRHIPERIVDNEYKIHQYHDKECPLYYHKSGQHYSGNYDYDTRSYPQYVASCKCKLGTEERWIITGKYIFRDIYPEHDVAEASAICGQVDMKTGGILMSYGRLNAKHVDGGIETRKNRLKSYNLVESIEAPAGPACIRCIRKREKQNGVS